MQHSFGILWPCQEVEHPQLTVSGLTVICLPSALVLVVVDVVVIVVLVNMSLLSSNGVSTATYSKLRFASRLYQVGFRTRSGGSEGRQRQNVHHHPLLLRSHAETQHGDVPGVQ